MNKNTPSNEIPLLTREQISQILARQKKEENRRFVKRIPLYLVCAVLIFPAIFSLTIPKDIIDGTYKFWFWQNYPLLESRGEGIWGLVLYTTSFILFYAFLIAFPYVVLTLIGKMNDSVQDNPKTNNVSSKTLLITMWFSLTVFLFHDSLSIFLRSIETGNFISDIKILFFRATTFFMLFGILTGKG